MMIRRLALTTFLAISSVAFASTDFNKAGFEAHVENGRLWVFKANSPELAAFKAQGEPAVSVSRIGEGPEGMTVRSHSQDIIDAYLSAK
jgi:hypothetical protein